MAKRTVPGLKLGGGKGKTVFWLGLVVLVALVVAVPVEMAGFVKWLFTAGDVAVTSVVTFINAF